MQAKEFKKARAQYESDGFYISQRSIIPDELVQRAVQGMDAVRAGEYETGMPPQPSLWNPGDNSNKLCKIEMPQLANRAIMELISYSGLGKMAAAITGAQMVQVWWVQLLYKPPGRQAAESNTHVGWHQDAQYWQVWQESHELFTAWVALNYVTAESGPMKFVRGSHKWGLLDKGNFYGQDHDAQRKEIEVPDGQTWEEVPVILPPGGVSFHQSLTYHGSVPNLSTKPRRSFAIHMRTEKPRPVGEVRKGVTQFIDDPSYCPVIYRKDATRR